MTEQSLQNTIRLYLSKHGYINFRCNVGKVRLKDGRFFDTGLPKGHTDVVAYRNGKAYFIEVKVGNNKASKEQLNFIDVMCRNGFTAGIVYSLEDLKKLLKKF